MALAVGNHLGAYEITGPLGAGGMGEVYRATDTHLKRDVAVKVLPPSFADDADRLARFQREAEVLASLNHPNIAQVYGLEKFAGTSALILELVEGPTLAERIEQGPISPDEALSIAMQIADALEAAHGRSIVHRDLKPANVKLTPDGTVKVLDFGIAKAPEPSTTSGGRSPTLLTPALTEAGVLLGTAAYMAPEQARAKSVDQRADIWAFGCVLYEMLTGQPAFAGEDVTTTLARILERNARLDALPAQASAAVRHTIKLCLEKDVRKRIADIRDVKLALAGAFDRDDGPSHTVAGPQASRTLYGSLAVAAALVAAIGFYFYALQPSAPARRVERFALDAPAGKVLGIDTQSASIAISPDGTQIAFPVLVNDNQYDWYVRRLDELAATPLRGAEVGAQFESPFFSPDGRWIGFAAAGSSLMLVSSAGGPAITISRLPENNIRGASWGDDNAILFGTESIGLWRVRSGGGEPEQLTTPAEGSAHRWPHWLPGGRAALFTIIEQDSARIALLDVESRDIRDLIYDGSTPSYSSTGHIVYAATDGSLRAAAFDLASRTVTGDPVPLLGNIAMTETIGAHYSLAADGSLVYMEGRTSQPVSRLVWVDRDGREEPIAAPARNYHYADISPDGRRIALDIREPDNDIWIWDVERETLARLTTDDGQNPGLAWSPDSQRVAFRVPPDGEIYWQAADGASAAQPLGITGQPSDITADGRIIYNDLQGGSRDVFMASAARGSSEPTPLLTSAAAERAASVSPNGRFIAYNSDESGRYEVYVRPFPDVSGGRWQISTMGGTRPIWNPNGTELVYFDTRGNLESRSGAVMAVPIEYDPVFRAGVPRKLFEGDYLSPNGDLHTYDMAPDGQRFVMIKAAEDESIAARLILVQNWVEELERLEPTE